MPEQGPLESLPQTLPEHLEEWKRRFSDACEPRGRRGRDLLRCRETAIQG
ncbi:MAG: hypothetical protein CM1200mP36_05710 [Gammaproteobacteria bacterium]|nr:MAG: hypothetical protein CM1200mP36_05710 [Gammaproteobacteria bacterium]